MHLSCCKRPRKEGRPLNTLTRITQGAVAICVFLFALFNGSVESSYFFPLASLFLLISTPIIVFRSWSSRIASSMSLAIGFGAFFLALTIVQVIQVPFSWAEHSIWQQVSEPLTISSGALSAHPWRTIQALPAFVLPVLVFMTCLVVSQSHESAERMWFLLTAAGLCILLTSIVLEIWFPNTMFFSSLPIGRSTFSGVFVNRNTSAAFFVLTGFALIGSLSLYLAKIRRCSASGYKRVLITDNQLTSVLLVLAIFGTVILIIVTQSRAGTLFGLPLLVLSLVVTWSFSKSRTRGRAVSSVAQKVLPLSLGLITLLIVFFGEPVMHRLGGELNDGRWCVWNDGLLAVRSAPWLGYGLGTFQDIFPAFRSDTCVTTGTWIRAHNSFLELYLGIGFLMFVPLGLIALQVIRTAMVCLATRRRLSGFAFVVLGLAIYLALHSLVDFPLQIPGVNIFAAALLGAGSGLCFARANIA